MENKHLRICASACLWGHVVWYVYVCNRKGQLYTGITTKLGYRMKQHRAELLYAEEFLDKHEAAKREQEIKGWRSNMTPVLYFLQMSGGIR